MYIRPFPNSCNCALHSGASRITKKIFVYIHVWPTALRMNSTVAINYSKRVPSKNPYKLVCTSVRVLKIVNAPCHIRKTKPFPFAICHCIYLFLFCRFVIIPCRFPSIRYGSVSNTKPEFQCGRYLRSTTYIVM